MTNSQKHITIKDGCWCVFKLLPYVQKGPWLEDNYY